MKMISKLIVSVLLSCSFHATAGENVNEEGKQSDYEKQFISDIVLVAKFSALVSDTISLGNTCMISMVYSGKEGSDCNTYDILLSKINVTIDDMLKIGQERAEAAASTSMKYTIGFSRWDRFRSTKERIFRKRTEIHRSKMNSD